MNPAEYKAKVASRYISVDPTQIGMKIIESDYYLCSHKLDGHLGILLIENERIILVDRTGDELHIPSIINAAKNIKTNVVLAGEICVYRNGKPGSNFDVSRAIADPTNHDIRFGVFDLLSDNYAPVSDDLKNKYDQLKKIISTSEIIYAVEQEILESRKEITNYYNQSIADYEGIIVRSSNGIVYKVKPVRTIDLAIIGFAEGIGERKGMIRDLMLACSTQKNEFLVVTHCGNGFSEEQRKELFDKLSPLSVDSNYLEVSGAKTAFIMVKPEFVAEISCLDIIGESGSGLIKKTLLSYDSRQGYQRSGLVASVSLISPVFMRLRIDKKSSIEDVGLSQIEDSISEMGKSDSKLLPDSEVIYREVYTKSSKGSTAVRKFIILKTNKEFTGEFSPYVVVYTDFSGGRKTPLEQEIYLCETENDSKDKILVVKDENIKKGWTLVNQ